MRCSFRTCTKKAEAKHTMCRRHFSAGRPRKPGEPERVICRRCDGDGYLAEMEGSPMRPATYECPDCNASGRVTVVPPKESLR